MHIFVSVEKHFASVFQFSQRVKLRKRWNATLRMLQAVVHPLVWTKLMQRRRMLKKNGRRPAKALSSNTLANISAVASFDSATPTCKYLPDELIERISDKLPLPLLLACRTVCKKWNQRIVSTLGPAATLPTKTVLVYFPPEGDFLHQSLIVYDSCSSQWVRHNMSFLHAGGVIGYHSLVAADRGLLCFTDATWTTFVVCNPLSKQWTVLLPPTSVLPHNPGMQVVGCPGDYILVGLVVDGKDGCYKLIVAGLIPKMASSRRLLNLSHTQQPRQSRTTFVYDSRFRSWSAAPALPMPPLRLDFGVWSNDCPRRSVTSEGNPYWSIVERSEDDFPVREVVRFDTVGGKWCSVALEEHSVRSLIALDGKIFAMKLVDGKPFRLRRSRGGGLQALYDDLGLEAPSSEWESGMFEVQDDVDGGGISLEKRELPKALRKAMLKDGTSTYGNYYNCIGHGTSLYVLHQVIDGDAFDGWNVLRYNSYNDSCVRLPHLNTSSQESFPLSWWILQPSVTELV